MYLQFSIYKNNSITSDRYPAADVAGDVAAEHVDHRVFVVACLPRVLAVCARAPSARCFIHGNNLH